MCTPAACHRTLPSLSLASLLLKRLDVLTASDAQAQRPGLGFKCLLWRKSKNATMSMLYPGRKADQARNR